MCQGRNSQQIVSNSHCKWAQLSNKAHTENVQEYSVKPIAEEKIRKKSIHRNFRETEH